MKFNFKRNLLFLTILFFFLRTPISFGQVYVSPNGSGNGSGSSWNNSATLQNAINNASFNSQLWLKQGNYNISTTLTTMVDNLAIYGGFLGNETSLNQRNWQSNLTTLNGQSTVKIMRFNATNGIIDGIRFINGYVTGSVNGVGATNDGGGALRLTGKDQIIRNCSFLNNTSTAERGAGAIFIWFGGGQLIENCIFQNNTHTYPTNANGGGAIHNWDEDVTIRNCQFINNSSTQNGGAIYTWGQNMTIEGCTFDNNHSDSNGGAINNINILYVTNSLFDSNSATEIGGAIFNSRELYVANSTFTSNQNTAIAHVTYASNSAFLKITDIYNSIFYNNTSTAPRLKDVDKNNNNTDQSTKDFRRNIFQENTFGVNNLVGVNPLFQNFAAGNFRLQTTSPGVDYGNNALYNQVSTTTAGASTDLGNNPRVFGSSIDLGAYELQQTQPTPNCTQLSSPANNSTNISINPNLTWSAVSNATGYLLYVGTSATNFNVLNGQDVGNVTSYQLNNLQQTTQYFVRVVPYNAVGNASGCTTTNFTTLTIPTAPNCTQLTAPANNSTNVSIDPNLTWSAVSNATGYLLYVGTSATNFNVLNGQDVGNVTSYQLNNLQQTTQYFVRVVPYNAVGNASGCTVESFTTEIITPECTTITAPLDGAVDVSVSTSIDWNISTNATGYYISIGTTSGGTDIANAIDVGNNTSYTPASNLPSQANIYVTITPYNTAGSATGCAEESFTTEIVAPECTTLTTPSNGATDASISTTINWNTALNATGYYISIGTTSGGNDIANSIDVGNATTYTPTSDLPSQTDIYVIITPYNSAGNATGCTEESFTTEILAPECTTLTTPSNGATDVSISTTINWNTVWNATGYYISIGTTSGGTDIANSIDVGNVTTYTPTSDLPSQTNIYVTITPYNSAGNAIGCTEESFTTEVIAPECTTILSPTDGSVDVSINPTIEWDAVWNATGYYISIGTSSGGTDIANAIDVGNNTSYTPASNLPSQADIYVTITPYNSAGNATGCTEESFTTEIVAPECTTLTTPSNGATDVSISTTINWNTVWNATGYYISIGTTSGGTDIANSIDVGNVTTYTPTSDLPSQTNIYVTITPYNTAGSATGCTEESFTTEVIAPECTTITNPSNGAIDVSINTAFTWDAVWNATGYYITIGTSAGGADIANSIDVGNVTSYTFSDDLPSQALLYVSVIPYNSAGTASACSEISFTTEVIPPLCTYMITPFDSTVDVDVTTPIAWEAVWNATGYYISLGTTPNGSELINRASTTTTTYNYSGELPDNTTIYVTITPYNSAGEANDCNSFSFTTENLQIITPSFFTPNGDGYNDYWEVTDPRNLIKTISIFDRYGKLLKQIAGNSSWNGNFNATSLPSSDYWYAIVLKDGKVLRGHFSLKR